MCVVKRWGACGARHREVVGVGRLVGGSEAEPLLGEALGVPPLGPELGGYSPKLCNPPFFRPEPGRGRGLGVGKGVEHLAHHLMPITQHQLWTVSTRTGRGHERGEWTLSNWWVG